LAKNYTDYPRSSSTDSEWRLSVWACRRQPELSPTLGSRRLEAY
jgi:hypothetical protein